MPPNGVRDKGRDRAASGGTFHDSPIPNQIPQQFRDTCGRCGALRVDRQIGLEATPEAYLATMVQVFREVRRVLRRDGTCWVNMGDSYSSGTGGDRRLGVADENRAMARAQSGAKPKDLLLMPARLALALQADGWWVRSAIVWAKPNPMPESVSDRPTSAYEMVYLLTRSSRYYYDADAVREAHAEPDRGKGEVERNNWSVGCDRGSKPMVREYNPAGRNLRNVWTIATHAYGAAHFATFPPELAERCIKAGTSERGCCTQCGKPWQRTTETGYSKHRGESIVGGQKGCDASNGWSGYPVLTKDVTTTGWSPGCQCGTTETRPCVVLDPFIGAGTTALVADRLQRDCIGIDLNTQYTRMAMDRCIADAPLFTSFAPAEPPEDERMADLFAGDEYQHAPPVPKPLQVPRGWDTGPGAHGTIHRTGRTLPDMAAD